MKPRHEIDDDSPDTLPEGCEQVWIRESPDDDPPEGFDGPVIDASEVDEEPEDDWETFDAIEGR